MKVLPRLFHFLCFLGLAATAALAVDRILTPAQPSLLLRAVFLGAVTGAPGLLHRKIWPLTFLVAPPASYLLLRATLPLSATVAGLSGQYHFYSQALQTGAKAYAAQFFPLNITDQPELGLLLALAVFGLVAVAALLSLGLQRPVPAIALLLVLFGFGLTVDTSARSITMVLLFVVLSACLLALAHSSTRRLWHLRDLVAGAVTGAAAGLLALGVLTAAPSAIADPWQDWRAWDPFRQTSAAYTFNWLQNYPQLLTPGNNVAVMSVEAPQPSYWKANTLDTFTGLAWLASLPFPEQVPVSQQEGQFFYHLNRDGVDIGANDAVSVQNAAQEVFHLESVYTNYLFVAGDALAVVLPTQVDLRTNDTGALHSTQTIGPQLDYRVTAIIPTIKPTDLVGKGGDYPQALDPYLALPFPRLSQLAGPYQSAAWEAALASGAPEDEEWADLLLRNREIVGEATDPYDKTLRIESYLRKSFRYSLSAVESDYSSPYAAFLFDTHTGYCQHFAGTMALLLRFNDIPARVAVGFTTGDLKEGRYVVSTNNAHAWVEAYFPEVGWVAFDPTPGRNLPLAGPSSTTPGFTNPFTTMNTAETTPTTTELTSLQTSPAPTLPDATVDSPSSTNSGLSWWGGPVIVIILVALLAAWPGVRELHRRRTLYRGSPASRLAASLQLLRADLADYGVPVGPASTTSETFLLAQDLLGLPADLALAERTDEVLFGGRPASSTDLRRVETLRRQVNVLLRRKYGWRRTIRKWYGLPRPRSA